MSVATEPQLLVFLPNPETKIVMVNSEMARKLLTHNKRNRPISDAIVARYKRDMKLDRWEFAGDPIRFDVDGNLIDGQHRLTALAQCDGLTLPFLLIQGLSSESQMVMDQGRKRTPGQQLALSGMKNYNQVAAGVKVYLVYSTGLLFRDNKLAQTLISSPEIEEWVTEHSDTVQRLGEYMNAIKSNDAPPSIAYASAIIFDAIDPVQSQEFFHGLWKGRGEGHPINTLDKRLQRIRRDKINESQRDLLALFVSAWNAWRKGDTITKFQRPRGGKWTASNFPEPR